MTVSDQDGQHRVEVQVYLDDLSPEAVRVELYAEGMNGGDALRREMTREQPLAGTVNGYLYSARVPATRSPADYTPRAIPHHAGVAVPLEAARILWER
jgi:starch phosphorylase